MSVYSLDHVTSAEPTKQPVVWRVRLLAGMALLTALAFRQSGGLIVPDTKLDLTANPGAFLLRALHMWDPSGAGGQLQNQAYGYLFPVGPFHWALVSLGVPGWIVQRLWWAVILCVAFLGVWRLITALGVGTLWSRYIAALLFAVSPRFLAEIAITSVEVWPMAMAAWVLLPLVTPEHRSWTWRISRSALAFGLVGGVNAVATGAVLVLPVLWFATRANVRQSLRFGFIWLFSVVVVALWWLIPLVLLAKYSPPFLDWIENAPVTTAFASPFEALRGTTPWLNYLSGAAGPSWPAGWLLVTVPGIVFSTAVVAVAGLVGVRLAPDRLRVFLAVSVLVGLALVTFGHTGTATSPLAGVLQIQLDGLLAPLRNTHKFELVVRVPLAIGLAAFLSALAAKSKRVGLAPWLLPIAAVSCVAIVSAPGITAGMARPEGYSSIPDYWRETAAWLDQQRQAGPNLVLPAAGFADFTWGSTKDDPLQALSTTPFLVRDAVPLGSAGTTRWLDSIERQLQSGRGGGSLRLQLQSAGVGHVVVRNDLRADAIDTGGGQSLHLHEALAEAGLSRVAIFGPPVGSPPGLPPESPDETVDQRTRLGYPSVEVFAVPSAASASLIPASNLAVLDGGAEDVANTLAVLPSSAAAIVGSDEDALPKSMASSVTRVVTDGNQSREVFFGRASNNRSQVLAPDAPRTTGRTINDYVADAGAAKTSRAWTGMLTSITASSSASDANASLRLSPGYGPEALVDGDPATAWVSGEFGQSVGQWVEIQLAAPVYAKELELVLEVLPRRVSAPSEVRLDSDAGTTTARIADITSSQKIALPRGPTRRIRITVTEVPTGETQNGVGLAEVSLPGVSLGSRLDVSQRQESGADVVSLNRTGDGRSPCAWVVDRPLCISNSARQAETEGGLRRWVDVATTLTGSMTGTVVPRAGEAAERLLRGVGTVEVVASSRAVPEAAGRPEAAMDGNLGTGWVAAPGDEQPTLTITLSRRTRTSGIQLQRDVYLAASRPKQVRVSLDGRIPKLLEVDDEGFLDWRSETVQTIGLTFVTTTSLRSTDSASGFVTTLPVGVSEVVVPGIEPRGTLGPSAKTGAACGFGPEVVIEGTTYETSVTGTVEDLLSGSPLAWQACKQDTLTIPGGGAAIDARATPEFMPETLVISSAEVDDTSGGKAKTAAPLGLQRPNPAELVVEVPFAPEDSVLLIHQNFNAGWAAVDARGSRLAPIRVNGWQQGWILSQGQGGRIRASFEPDRTYQVGLALGLLVFAAAIPITRRPGARLLPPLEQREVLGNLMNAFVLVMLGMVGGAFGLFAGVISLMAARWLGSRSGVSAVSAAAGVIAAALVAADRPWPEGLASVDDSLVQVLILVSVGAAATYAAERGTGRSPRRPQRMIGRSTR